MTVEFLILPGTGYPNGGDGICEALIERLDPAFTPHIVSYPAAYGGTGDPYATSREAGEAALRQRIQESEAEHIVIGGYSQGAVCAGNVALTADSSLVIGCALIADGNRPQGAGGTSKPAAPGYGIDDPQRDPRPNIPTWWAAVPGDPITACPPHSPLRLIADMSEWYSIRSPQDIAVWGAHVLNAMIQGQMQNWWRIEQIGVWAEAVDLATNYLFEGHHGVRYISEGHIQALADQVNAVL